jgi:hypothetical protein
MVEEEQEEKDEEEEELYSQLKLLTRSSKGSVSGQT